MILSSSCIHGIPDPLGGLYSRLLVLEGLGPEVVQQLETPRAAAAEVEGTLRDGGAGRQMSQPPVEVVTGKE